MLRDYISGNQVYVFQSYVILETIPVDWCCETRCFQQESNVNIPYISCAWMFRLRLPNWNMQSIAFWEAAVIVNWCCETRCLQQEQWPFMKLTLLQLSVSSVLDGSQIEKEALRNF